MPTDQRQERVTPPLSVARIAHGGNTKRPTPATRRDRKSTRLNSSHLVISYAVFCLKKKKKKCRARNCFRDICVERCIQDACGYTHCANDCRGSVPSPHDGDAHCHSTLASRSPRVLG